MGNELSAGADLTPEERDSVLGGEANMKAIADKLKSGTLKNVIVIAGVSQLARLSAIRHGKKSPHLQVPA